MKKLYLIVLFLSPYLLTEAQDVIKKMNGEVINANVLSITEEEVQYTDFDSKSDSIISLQKTELYRIDYANGIVTVFADDSLSTEVLIDSSMFGKGQWAARQNFTGYKSAATGTLITTIIFPVYGLIPAVICSSTPPKPINLNYPVNEFSQDADYLRGYQSMAYKMKSRKVWKNYGIGAGIWVGALTVMVVAVSSVFMTVD